MVVSKHPIARMSNYQNVILPKTILVPKCLLQLSRANVPFTKMSGYRNLYDITHDFVVLSKRCTFTSTLKK